MKTQSAKYFEVHKGEDGGYVSREPWADGRLWIAKTFDVLLNWITTNVCRQDI